MLKPPRAACALLASGLLAACSRGPASTPAPAAATEPPASSQPPVSPGPAAPPSAAAQPPAAPVQPGPASPASTVQPSSAAQAPAPTTTQPSATPQAPADDASLPPAPALPLSPVLREVAAVGPGGAVTALARTGETVVDPAATFRVELSVATADARLVLLDAADALVAASSSREVGATTTRLRVSPSVPLEPGCRYTLRLDGAVTRELHDASGKAYLPAALALRAAGQPPPPEPKAKPKKRRR